MALSVVRGPNNMCSTITAVWCVNNRGTANQNNNRHGGLSQDQQSESEVNTGSFTLQCIIPVLGTFNVTNNGKKFKSLLTAIGKSND